MAMGDLARPDEYTVEDDPWARGVRAAQDYAARETPEPQPNVMGSLLGMGRAGETIGEGAATTGRHMADYFMTPGRVVGGLENPYPRGSEEADYVDRANQAAANQYAIGTGFGMVFDPGLYLARGSIGAGVAGRIKQPQPEQLAAKPTQITVPVGGRLPQAETPVSKGEQVVNVLETVAAPNLLSSRYLINPQRDFTPSIYQDPRAIAQAAAANTIPEHPALKQLFGVTRDDLWQIGGRGTRQGNMEPQIWMPEKARGSEAAQAAMTPQNAQRLIDTLAEARKYPELARGMEAWYVMDPAYHEMVRLFGPERALTEYRRFNASMTPFSAGSPVPLEITRGTAARMMFDQGSSQSLAFQRYGGFGELNRAGEPNFPAALQDVPAHVYHRTQADPALRYLETGSHGYDKDTVKIPLYTQASGVPQTGFQTKLAVPDTHFAASSGLPDVRRTADPGGYMSGAEYRSFGPWYTGNVAKPLGIEAVPAQALQWGAYAPFTGVETKVGAPKLELIAKNIWDRAQQLGIDPRVLRDQVLMGKAHATWLLPAVMAGKGVGALAAQDRYEQ